MKYVGWILLIIVIVVLAVLLYLSNLTMM